MSRILVVEDESAIAELISINLRHAGFEVTLAASAASAQYEVDRVLPDLVVLDWMLPGQSGVALARQWRSTARTKELPVIMLTARAEEGDKIAGLDAGADDYVTKPFSTNELLARIRAVLRRARMLGQRFLVDIAVQTKRPELVAQVSFHFFRCEVSSSHSRNRPFYAANS